jgi:uncharacterized protein (DUF697 family)
MSTYEYETGELELGETGELGESGELGLGEFELGESGELGEGEGEGEGEGFLGDILGGEFESPLSEAQEMELAGELLEVGSEQELEQFLGNIFKGVANAVGGVIKSPIGRALGGVLKNVAKTALPVVGGALGSFVAPGLGTALGSKLGSMAGNLLELEGEVSAEQAEFEVARHVVRLSAAAAQKAAVAPPHLPPRQVAHTAVVQAARQVVPGALRPYTAHHGRDFAARGAVTYGARHGGARLSPEYRRRLAALPPSARLAAGYAQGRPRHAGAAAGYGAPRHRHTRPGAPGYGFGAVDAGIEEPFGIGAGGVAANGFGGGGQRTGRWVRRGRKIILLGV